MVIDPTKFFDKKEQERMRGVVEDSQNRERKSFNDENELKLSHNKETGEKTIYKIWFIPSIHEVPFGKNKGKPQNILSYRQHFYKEGNKWIAEMCPRTNYNYFDDLEKEKVDCPFCDYVKAKWPYVDDDDNTDYFKRRSKETVYTNVYVERDTGNADHEGKVMYVRMPKDVVDAYRKKMSGEKDGDEYIVKPDNLYTYPKSRKMIVICEKHSVNPKWSERSVEWSDKEKFLGGDKEKIVDVFNQTHNLYEKTMKRNYEDMKTPDEMKAYLESVYTTKEISAYLDEGNGSESSEEDEVQKALDEKPKEKKTKKNTEKKIEKAVEEKKKEEDDDDLSFDDDDLSFDEDEFIPGGE